MTHDKRVKTIIIVFGVMGLVSGCVVTPALLDKVNPQERVMVSSKETSEEALQKKGCYYTKSGEDYMVEKSSWRKAGDYAMLGVGLPFAVVADGVYVLFLRHYYREYAE